LVVDAEELLLRSCPSGHVPKYWRGVVNVKGAEMGRATKRIDRIRLCYEYVQAGVYSRSVLECDLGRSKAYAHNCNGDHEDEYFQPSNVHNDRRNRAFGLFRLYIQKDSQRYPVISSGKVLTNINPRRRINIIVRPVFGELRRSQEHRATFSLLDTILRVVVAKKLVQLIFWILLR
jgi:hypothetical protein